MFNAYLLRAQLKLLLLVRGGGCGRGGHVILAVLEWRRRQKHGSRAQHERGEGVGVRRGRGGRGAGGGDSGGRGGRSRSSLRGMENGDAVLVGVRYAVVVVHGADAAPASAASAIHRGLAHVIGARIRLEKLAG